MENGAGQVDGGKALYWQVALGTLQVHGRNRALKAVGLKPFEGFLNDTGG